MDKKELAMCQSGYNILQHITMSQGEMAQTIMNADSFIKSDNQTILKGKLHGIHYFHSIRIEEEDVEKTQLLLRNNFDGDIVGVWHWRIEMIHSKYLQFITRRWGIQKGKLLGQKRSANIGESCCRYFSFIIRFCWTG